MSSNQHVKQIDIACSFLQKLIDTYNKNGNSHLPPLRKLSKMTGISSPTMYRAIQKFKNDGIIESIQGSGLIISSAYRSEHFTIHKKDLWKPENVCAIIERDIINGFYKPGEKLLTFYEMMNRYGASYRTLRKALQLLAEYGSIVPFRKSYKVSVPHTQAHANKIVLLTSEKFELTPWWNNAPRVLSHMHMLEKECSRKNLSIDKRIWRNNEEELYFEKGLRFTEKELYRTMGFFIFTTGSNMDFLESLLTQLIPYKKPVVLFNEKYNTSELLSLPVRKSNIRCFCIGLQEQDGIDVGRYLLQLGHKRVIYLAYGGKTMRNPRLDGLRRAFAYAGLENSVENFHFDIDIDFNQLVKDESYTRLTQQLERPQHAANPLGMLIYNAIKKGSDRMSKLLYEESIMQQMSPIIDSALSNGVTAFVGYNDEIAALCLDYILSKNISVPDDASIIGFDDSYIASVNNMTSYNFNSETAIHAAISHLLFGKVQPGEKRENIVMVKGYVTQRASSGPIKKGR